MHLWRGSAGSGFHSRLPKTITLAIVIVVAAATLVLAHSLTGTVLAKKQQTCTVGSSDTLCNATTSGTSAARQTCTAESNFQTHPNCP
jgi:hypothetical protein